jgi:hypothetical protein
VSGETRSRGPLMRNDLDLPTLNLFSLRPLNTLFLFSSIFSPMSTQCVTPQANKENSGDDKAHAITTPSSIETSASSTSSTSKQRVIFSKRNQEHFFDPVLAANPTPLSTQEPSKSILKKRTYDEYLAEDGLFGSLVPQRSSTPEPDTEEGLAAYLLSPVSTLVQSIQNARAGGVDNQDIIEAYCVLTARIRAKFLPTTGVNGTNEEGPELPKGWHPAMQPIQDHVDHLVCAMTRDIARAREDPLKDFPSNPADKPLAEGDMNAAAATLPSPPPSSPPPFDPQATPKRSGMNEQQVKHARDLCTVSQSAMKLLAALFCFPETVQSGELFTGTSSLYIIVHTLTHFCRNASVYFIERIACYSSLVTSPDSQLSKNISIVDHPPNCLLNTLLLVSYPVFCCHRRRHYTKRPSHHLLTSSWHRWRARARGQKGCRSRLPARRSQLFKGPARFLRCSIFDSHNSILNEAS